MSGYTFWAGLIYLISISVCSLFAYRAGYTSGVAHTWAKANAEFKDTEK